MWISDLSKGEEQKAISGKQSSRIWVFDKYSRRYCPYSSKYTSGTYSKLHGSPEAEGTGYQTTQTSRWVEIRHRMIIDCWWTALCKSLESGACVWYANKVIMHAYRNGDIQTATGHGTCPCITLGKLGLILFIETITFSGAFQNACHSQPVFLNATIRITEAYTRLWYSSVQRLNCHIYALKVRFSKIQ